jgi:Uncharacterized protein conserved in bacteria C-term(DUF2220)
MNLSALAAAMAAAVAAAPRQRVPLAALVAAAAAVDRTGAASVEWRRRLATAIAELADVGVVELPRTRWDHASDPALPAYVTKPRAAPTVRASATSIVWHVELGWAAQLDAHNGLGERERRFLAQINTWLRRRADLFVPQRERSLDICGDEKALDEWVFTPLFAAGRLTHQMLRCRPCWPPVHQEILGQGSWLIVENWTTYCTLAEHARSVGWNGRIIWGAGNQVGTRITSLAATEAAPDAGIRYFGDIDTAGFRIAQLAASRAITYRLGLVQPAVELYRLCIDVGHVRATPHQAGNQTQEWTIEWLGRPLGARVAAVIADGGRIVQEEIGVERLSTCTVPLLDSP